MKNFAKRFLTLLFSLSLIFSFCACRKDEEPEHTHTFGEWTISVEASFESEGERSRKCSGCEETETEKIPALVAAYYITIVDGESEKKIPLLDNGVYTIDPAQERIGYSFTGYFDASGNAFALSGTVTSNVTVYPRYEILDTTTFAQLKERMEAGADIRLAGNITLEDTIYVSSDITVTSTGSYTLTRSEGFLGDLFMIGTYSNGGNPLFDQKTPSLTIEPKSDFTITFDGNKNSVTGAVSGTAFFLKNSATLNIYDGVEIVNCKKTANSYLLNDAHNISDHQLTGGAAVIIANGTFNMYGGAIRNCEVDMDDSAYTSEENQTEGYNYSSRGGAVFNYGSFNMHDGVIENCQAGRGGAIYNYRVMYLYAGEIKNNKTNSYGGAIYNPNSQYVYSVIGQEGKESKLIISGNTSEKTGGAIYSAHQATVYVVGSTLFKENKALSGNGGAINAAGAVVVDYAVFEKNTASSKGGAIYAYYNSPENTIRLVEIKSALFKENESPRGGAIGLSTGEDAEGMGTRAEIGDVEFINNKAPLSSSDKYGYGAAIHIDQGSVVTVYGNAKFEGNQSHDNGGAIYITKSSTLTINAGSNTTISFKENVSGAGNGGAIYNSGSMVTMHASNGGVLLIEGNEATVGNGGAIAAHSSGTVKLYGVTFKTNSTPDGKGGALYVYGANAVIGDESIKLSSTFSGNSATNGGAIYVSSTSSAAATFNCYELSAESNTSTSGGGAIYVVADKANSTTFNATTLNLTKNEAGGNGGAMYIYTNAQVNIENVNATENETADGKYGGFAYVSGKATVYIGNITANNNSAGSGGAIYLTTSGTSLTVAGGNITANSAESDAKGNAVWVNSSGSTLKVKTDESDSFLLTYSEGDILGVSGFEIQKYKEATE